MNAIYYYKTAIGIIGIAESDGYITELTFGKKKNSNSFIERETELIKKAHNQLEEYLSNKRKVFKLPLKAEGTEFQRLVWNELQKIPFGEVRFYSEIAKNINSPKAARAVGMACNRNPIAIFIPCHRVIGKDFSLTGFGGGLWLKEYLLNLEKDSPYAFEDI
jgi:methylated-DNA-[protein]-cysteine S-methyltransferase